jgi:MFS family permease
VSLAAAGTLPGDALLYTVLPIVWSDLGLELWMVGVLLSANRFVRLATNSVAGWVVGRAGVRGPFVIAVFASALTTMAYGLGIGFVAFLVARALWGFCWSFIRLGGYLAALGSSDASGRGFALGFYSGVASFGTLLAVFTGGILTDQIGFRSTVFLFAGFAAVAGLAMLRERPAPSSEPDVDLGDDPVSPMGDGLAPRRRRWAVYGATFVSTATGVGLVVSTLGLWLVEVYGASVALGSVVVGVATLNGFLLAVRFLAGTVWAPPAGHLSDRFGRLRIMGLAGGVVAACLVGLSLRFGLAWTIGMAFGLFFSGVALRVTLDATAGDLAPPELRSRIMSAYANASDLGAAVGPFVAYPLAATVGLDWVYRGSAVGLLVAGVAALLLLRPGPPTGADSSSGQAHPSS